MKGKYINEEQFIQMLEFLERQYYEDKVYFCLERFDGEGYVEIINDKSIGKGWFIGIRDDSVRVMFPANRVLDEVEALGGLVNELGQRVTQRALDIASYAYERAQEVSEILGEEAILENIKAHKAFSDNLVAAIKSVLGVNDKPKLRLITKEKE